MSGGSSHEHIAGVKISDGATHTVEQEIRQLKSGDTDYVQDALGNRAYIRVRVRS